jgi:glucose/arabinose dehydrogenase
MKKIFLGVIGVMILIGVIWGALFYWQNLRGLSPAIKAPPQEIAALLEGAPAGSGKQAAPLPLKLPPGFTISVFAKNLGNPRVLALDPAGNLLVSLTHQGKVAALPDRDQKGRAEAVVTVAEGLERPHGLAFRNGKLYIAETERVALYDYNPTALKASNPRKIMDLPPKGRHFTRTLLFPPALGGRLLISVGSDCDTCVEKDWRYAKILAAAEDGSHLQVFAAGLRNAVFMTAHPVTGQIWVTEMGRDFLGDDLPPDEINIIQEGKNYGWPYCYGKRVHDRDFDPQGTHQEFCKQTEPSYIDIPAHSAPLGLAFFPGEGWPEEYQYNLLVAYHGSWNRSVPTGYKVVRYKLDSQGKVLGVEDFLSGWLTGEGALGRPVDILIKNNGVMYIADDKAGVVYRVTYKR